MNDIDCPSHNIQKTTYTRTKTHRRSRTPFVHKFQTLKNKYVLDVNTNRVLRINSVIWDIVDDFGALCRDDLVQKYSDKYKQAEIHTALNNIASLQQRSNLLLPRRFELAPLSTYERVREAIENQRRMMTLCVTEDCNYRCSYCIYNSDSRIWRKHSKRRMNWNVAQLAIDDFVKHSTGGRDKSDTKLSIGFYGGEPLLNLPIIKQCVAYSRQKLGDLVTFHITTNGSLLTGDAAKFLASENFVVQVSLDGPRPIHDARRHFVDGRGTWEVTINNFRDFVKRYPKYKNGTAEVAPALMINAVLPPSIKDYSELDEFFCFQIYKLLGTVPDCTFNPEVNENSPQYKSVVPNENDIMGLENFRKQFLNNLASGAITRDPENKRWRFQRELFDKAFWDFLNRPIASSKYPFLNGSSRLECMCFPGTERLFVSADGGYYPCERVPNVDTFKIGDVWNGIDVKKSYSIKKKFDSLCENDCKDCWCVNLCDIFCCSDTRDGDKITSKAKRKQCKQYRSKTHRVLIDLFGVLECNPHACDYLKRGKIANEN